MGVALDCPRHPDGHRVELWFENPGDGGPPTAVIDELHHAWLEGEAEDLNCITVLPTGSHQYRPVEIGHWVGWLIEGELTEARINGVAW